MSIGQKCKAPAYLRNRKICRLDFVAQAETSLPYCALKALAFSSEKHKAGRLLVALYPLDGFAYKANPMGAETRQFS